MSLPSTHEITRLLKCWTAGEEEALDEAPSVCNEPDPNLVVLDDALKALATIDERESRVVELRYFGGLSARETAEVLKVSPETVMRDWRLAKTWILREVSEGHQRGA